MQNNSTEQGWFTSPVIPCNDWLIPQHSVFQLGSFIIVNGFLVPPNVGLSQALWLRSTLVIGSFCYVLWAAPVMCWPDAFGWNMANMLINLVHLMYIAYLVYPTTFDDDVEKVYETHFRPFNISKKEFRRLLDCDGEIYELDATGRYAVEQKTRIDKQIALLLSGRMVVSADGTFLHYVHPTQFMDSPEWEASLGGSKGKFQVTITAESDCRYIQWRRRKLDDFLRREPFLRSVFETSIGKDITKKLYCIDEPTEQPAATAVNEKSPAQTNIENETGHSSGINTSLDAPDADSHGLLSHKWERVISEDDDSSTHQHGGGGGPLQGRLSIPASHDGTSSDVSVKSVRSIVDIRASIASGKGAADVGGRRSRLGSTPDASSDGAWWRFF